MEVVVEGVPITLHIRRSKRARHAKIRALVDRLEVVLPTRSRDNLATNLVNQHKDWVLTHHLSLQSRIVRVSTGSIWFQGMPYKFELGADHKVAWLDGVVSARSEQDVANWLWRESRSRLEASVSRWSPIMGVAPTRLSFRKQKTVWGSCSTSGTVSFNLRLVMAPPTALDYVVIHELAHIHHPNHSRAFWCCVAEFDPDFKSSEKWLKTHYADLRACLAEY